jgi:hypothetical protein
MPRSQDILKYSNEAAHFLEEYAVLNPSGVISFAMRPLAIDQTPPSFPILWFQLLHLHTGIPIQLFTAHCFRSITTQQNQVSRPPTYIVANRQLSDNSPKTPPAPQPAHYKIPETDHPMGLFENRVN